MSRTEELIAKAQQGDREASEALVEENSGLIWSVARRFLGRGTEADDLYQRPWLRDAVFHLRRAENRRGDTAFPAG